MDMLKVNAITPVIKVQNAYKNEQKRKRDNKNKKEKSFEEVIKSIKK